MLLERYAAAGFSGQQDFEQNFHINIPGNFNFTRDCIDELARTSPDKTALLWCDDKGNEARFSFAQLSQKASAAAAWFAQLGIARGDAVMLILKRRPQFWFALLGLIRLGAVAVPATHQLTARDILYRNRAADTKAIVAVDDEAVLQACEDAKKDWPGRQYLIKLGAGARDGWLNYDAGVNAAPRADVPYTSKNEDVMLLYFTSGTTGPPKMVAHNQLYPLGHIVTARYWHNLHPGSLHLTVADSGWAKAVWGKLFGQWLCEAAVFVYDHDYFDAKKLLEVVSRHRVTSLCAPPTIYRYLIRTNLAGADLSALEWATTAGEPLNPEISRQFLEKTGIDIHEAFGQTETVPLLLTTPYMAPRHGWLGRPNPTCEVLLLGTGGQPVSDGEVGEICVKAEPGRTPGMFVGYYREPERTRGIWRGNIYHTGDLALRGADGYYQFVGRDDDVIKASSYRIGPFEVESVLMEHPAVVECAVTGVPDAQRGQAVKASVILAPQYKGSDALARELQQFVKDNTAPYKCPRFVEFVHTLPKTISGKIKRAEIRGRQDAAGR